MDDEVQALISEIDRVGTSTKYSSLTLFGEGEKDGKSGLANEGATFQVGANKEDDNTIKADAELFKKISFSALTKIKDGSFKLVDIKQGKATEMTDGFKTALEDLDAAIDNITDRKSIIGAAQNRLSSALETLTIQQENLSSAKSIIKV